MADGLVQVPPDSTGKKIDAASMDVGVNTVMRQRIVIGDNSATAQFALVTGNALTVTGTMNISAMPTVTVNSHAVSLVAGTANIGFINNISATVNTVAGLTYVLEKTTNSQVLVGDSANAALRVNVVAGSAGGPSMTDNTTYSTGVSLVAPGGYAFFDASAVAVTEGRIAAARITGQRAIHANLRTDGGVKLEDSTNSSLRVSIVADSLATAVVAIMSASHGPKNVIASTSAFITLIASPGAGKSIFVTMLGVSNAGGTATLARVGTSASGNTIVMMMAATGGGFVMNFDPPWQLSASEAAVCSVKPNVSESRFNVQFYVA